MLDTEQKRPVGRPNGRRYAQQFTVGVHNIEMLATLAQFRYHQYVHTDPPIGPENDSRAAYIRWLISRDIKAFEEEQRLIKGGQIVIASMSPA